MSVNDILARRGLLNSIGVAKTGTQLYPAALVTIAQAEKPGLGARRLRALCSQGRIAGAQLLGGVWLLPEGFAVTPGRPAGNPNWRRKLTDWPDTP